MEMEQRCHHDRDILLEVDEKFLRMEHKEATLKKALKSLQVESALREAVLKAEITDLEDKIWDFGLRNDYLDSKVLELERDLENKETALTKSR